MNATTFLLLLSASASAGTALTIYNGDLAVVRESLPLDLKAGDSVVTFDRATAQVMPESVVLRDPAAKNSFSILEQGYRNDPVSQALLLSHFEGREIDFRISYPDGRIEVKPAKIIRSGYVPGGNAQDPIIEMDGRMRFTLPGQPLFPALGDDSILHPTLSWTLNSDSAAKFDAQLSYLTHGFGWEATYNIVAPENSDTVSFSGWVTVTNRSGTAFQNAAVKLVAGDVNVVQPAQLNDRLQEMEELAAPAAPAPAVTEKAFDDFHLYTLGRPLTLRDQETKQVEFQRAPQVNAVRKYIYDPLADRPGEEDEPSTEPENGQEFSRKIDIYWEFRNDESNGLGVPLPAGKIQFYRTDSSDGSLQFVGEDRIQHTPKNEKLSLHTGSAFDLTGERKVMNFTRSGRQRAMSESIEITVKNHSHTAREIVIREHPWRWSNWQIIQPSDPFTRTNASQIEFTVKLAPDEEKKVTYTANYTW